MTTPVQEHAWLPKASCDASCIRVDSVHISRPFVVVLRTTVRLIMTMLLLPALPFRTVNSVSPRLAKSPEPKSVMSQPNWQSMTSRQASP